uniref:Uncharacterized protein n=1 Tax=Lactuca sativa TaxID=4236 RepID=A0A9R1WFB6_LACSA|nr:hypothetical protein LSAT_V11C100048240 [Lactuca sativa]
MPPFPSKGHPTRLHKNMHRLLQRYTNEPSSPTSTLTIRPTTSASPLFGTPSAIISNNSSTPSPTFSPISTPTLTPTTSTPIMFSTLLAPSSTSSPLFSTLSTPSSISAPSSSPSSTTTPSFVPSSTTTTSTPVAIEQQDALLEQCMHIKVRANALLPSHKCSSIIKKTFLDKVDENGYKWVTFSDETKHFYWEEKNASGMLLLVTQSSRLLGNRRPKKDIDVGGKAPPTHNGGSTSHQQIVADMEEYTGKALSCYELFMFTHTKDHDRKTFQVNKAKEVHLLEDMTVRKESIFRENSSQTYTSPDSSFEKHHLETKIQKLEETIDQQRMELDDVRNMSYYGYFYVVIM